MNREKNDPGGALKACRRWKTFLWIIAYHFFTTQKFLQKENVFVIVHLYCWDHGYKVNEWCLNDCFHREFRLSTKISKIRFFSWKDRSHFAIATFLIRTLVWDQGCKISKIKRGDTSRLDLKFILHSLTDSSVSV